MFHFKIDMAQFRNKVKIFADNVDDCNTIEWTGGDFQCQDPQRYIDLLNEYNVFYTMRVSSPRDGGWYPTESYN